jgi:integrase
MPVVHAKPTIPWTAEQAKYFIEQTKDDQYFVAYLMMITYGLRVGEMLGLRWTDIDFHNDMFVIRQQIIRTTNKLLVQTVKTDASRCRLPLVPVVRQALLDHAAKNGVNRPQFTPDRELTGEGLVITTGIGTPLEPNGFRKRCFYTLTEKYRLPPIKMHGLRHTAATLLKDMGVPVKDVQEILGHTWYTNGEGWVTIS